MRPEPGKESVRAGPTKRRRGREAEGRQTGPETKGHRTRTRPPSALRSCVSGRSASPARRSREGRGSPAGMVLRGNRRLRLRFSERFPENRTAFGRRTVLHLAARHGLQPLRQHPGSRRRNFHDLAAIAAGSFAAVGRAFHPDGKSRAATGVIVANFAGSLHRSTNPLASSPILPTATHEESS